MVETASKRGQGPGVGELSELPAPPGSLGGTFLSKSLARHRTQSSGSGPRRFGCSHLSCGQMLMALWSLQVLSRPWQG